MFCSSLNHHDDISFFMNPPIFPFIQSLLLPFVCREKKSYSSLSAEKRLRRPDISQKFFMRFPSASIQLFRMDMMKMEVRLYQINFLVLSFIANTDFLLLTEETFFASYFLLLLISFLYYLGSSMNDVYRKMGLFGRSTLLMKTYPSA